MATYVVGDVHGSFRTLERLLLALPFEKGRDHLWLTGDLVNRGPGSLEVLRWAEATSRSLGDRFVTVLGNHDIHLLASAAGLGRAHHQAALAPVLAAPDRDFLVGWLARRPLFHRDRSAVLVHAGLLPEWTLDEAAKRATALEERLGDEDQRQLLMQAMAEGNTPSDLFAFTQLRLIDEAGLPSEATCAPTEAAEGLTPWFEVSGRKSAGELVVAGHWAALGLHVGQNFVGLDSGCGHGGPLTAIRLEDLEVFAVPNADSKEGKG